MMSSLLLFKMFPTLNAPLFEDSSNERLFQIRTQSLFMCFWGERRLGARLRSARGVMGRDDTHDTPRAPQPKPNLLSPKKHTNSDWVRVCGCISHVGKGNCYLS